MQTKMEVIEKSLVDNKSDILLHGGIQNSNFINLTLHPFTKENLERDFKDRVKALNFGIGFEKVTSKNLEFLLKDRWHIILNILTGFTEEELIRYDKVVVYLPQEAIYYCLNFQK